MAVTLLLLLCLAATFLAFAMASEAAPPHGTWAMFIRGTLLHKRGVVSGVRVATGAVSLYALTRSRNATAAVFQVGHKFHMAWIDALANAAKVIHLKTFWYRAAGQRVTDTVSLQKFSLAAPHLEGSVPAARSSGQAASPQPAFSRLVHLGPEILRVIGELVPRHSHFNPLGVSPEYTPKGATS